MAGRLGLLKSYCASVRDEIASKLHGTYVSNKTVVGSENPGEPSPVVEYPQKSYEPPLDAPGYEQLVEPVVEVASEPMTQGTLEQDVMAEAAMRNEMMLESALQGGPVGLEELSAAQEIDLAIEEASGRGVSEEVAFEGALNDVGFFEDVVVDAPGGLEEVLGDPFGDQEVVDGLEALFEEQVAQEQVMDDQFGGGFDGGGMC